MTDPTLDDNGGAHPVFPWLTEPRRAWAYRVILAAQPIAVVISARTDNVVPLCVAFALAVIGTGSGAVHTTTKP